MLPRTLAVCFLLLLGVTARAAGPFDDLLRRAPANTNTLALIDVTGTFASPLAQKENWAEKTRAGGGGLGFVPADASQLAIASEVNFNSMVRSFQVALIRVRNVPTMTELANREGGTQDEIAGRLAVLSPRNVYFTTFSGTELAAVYPADRQATARWLRSAMSAKAPPLSPYLLKAAEQAGGNAVTVALDLQDVADRNLLALTLAASPSVAKHKDLDVPVLARFLSQVRGMTFSVKVGENIKGTLVVEFPIEPARHRRVLPDLILELIDDQGVWIPGIEQWEVNYTDTTISFTGPMTTVDLKRVVSLFAFPQAIEEEPGKAGEASAPATRRYLAAVEAILDDLRAMKDSPNLERMATWHDKAAAQIEHLSRRGVDPLATQAAFDVSKRLRAIADSLRGVPIDVKALEAQKFYHSQASLGVVPSGWWGWQPFIIGPTQVQTNIPKIQAEIAQVIANDQKQRNQTWSDITRILVDAKKTLADKYKTPF